MALLYNFKEGVISYFKSYTFNIFGLHKSISLTIIFLNINLNCELFITQHIINGIGIKYVEH